MKTISNLTDLEKKVLQSVASLMYAEWGFSDVGATDVSEDINVSIKVVRGALGSQIGRAHV